MGLADLIRAEYARMAGLRQPAVSSWPERDAALEAVRVFDVERGYRAPSEWDHVHRVERDAPPEAELELDDGSLCVCPVCEAVLDEQWCPRPACVALAEGCLGG